MLQKRVFRPKRIYPPIPHYLSDRFITFCTGISLLLGAITLCTMIYLAVDVEFCGTNASQHAVYLTNTTTFNANRAGTWRSFPIGAIPVYDGGHDTVTLSPPDAAAIETKQHFPLAIVLNYTSYVNTKKHTFLTSLGITGASTNVSTGGGSIALTISNPSRKRLYVTDPWFDYGYWTTTFSGQPTENDIPLWYIDMKEAARGRRNGRICTANYSVAIGVSASWFQINPLLIREFAGSECRITNISLPGAVILDTRPLLDSSNSSTLSLTLSRADISQICISCPTDKLVINYVDSDSFLDLRLPFPGASNVSLCRTIEKSPRGTRYMCPSVVLTARNSVAIEFEAAASQSSIVLDNIFCQAEQVSGRIVFFTTQSTVSRILLLVTPLGHGACVCAGKNAGLCSTG